jgi:chromosome segregation ATPase
MSHWKAYAQASAVSDAELRSELIRAYETIHGLAAALECEPREAVLLDAIDELRSAEDEAVEAQAAAAEAEERLEAKLREDQETELGKLRTECEELRAELKRLQAAETVENAYADCLAMARRFVSVAQGIKPARHARAVKP